MIRYPIFFQGIRLNFRSWCFIHYFVSCSSRQFFPETGCYGCLILFPCSKKCYCRCWVLLLFSNKGCCGCWVLSTLPNEERLAHCCYCDYWFPILACWEDWLSCTFSRSPTILCCCCEEIATLFVLIFRFPRRCSYPQNSISHTKLPTSTFDSESNSSSISPTIPSNASCVVLLMS